MPVDAKELGDLNLYISLGKVYFEAGRSDSCDYYFIEAEKIANKYITRPDRRGVREFYIEYGKILSQNKNEKSKSFALFQTSLNLLQQTSPDFKESQAEIYLEISKLFKTTGQQDSSLYYSQKAKQLLKIKDLDLYQEFVRISKKGDSAYYKDNYSKAINYFEMAVKNETRIFYTNDWRVADVYYNTGKSYAELHNYKKAIDFTWKAFHIYESITNNRNSECRKALSKLLIYYQETNQTKELEGVRSLLTSFEE